MKKFLSAAAVLAIASGAQAAVVYSTGFESPFAVASLNGQQGWACDAGSIANAAGGAHSGSQYAQMTGTQIQGVGTASWGWYTGAGMVPGNQTVVMTCYAGIFNYSGTRAFTAGLDAYDSSVARIGAVYLTSDGNIGVIDGTGAGGATTGLNLALNVYRKLQMVANYGTGSIDFLVDDVLIFTGSFTNTDFGDADIRGTRGSTGTGGGTVQMRFDDYSIEVIPTPGTLALMGMGGLLAARRRRA